MKKISVILTFMIFIRSTSADCQSNCPNNAIYNTSTIGNGKDSLVYPLRFEIKGDLLLIYNNMNDAKSTDYTFYKITKQNCKWNQDYTIGESTFELSLETKGKIVHPTMNISIKDKNGVISLQYENSEPRLFKIVCQ